MFRLKLKDLRESKGLSQQQLADILNVSQGSVGNWESGTREPNFKIITKIAELFEVSVDYLLDTRYIKQTEINHARKKIKRLYEENPIDIQIIEEKLNVNYGTFKSWIDGYGDFFNSAIGLANLSDLFNVSVDYLLGINEENKATKNSIKTPVLGYVAAGIPIEAIEDIVDYEELDTKQFNPNYEYFGLKIKGDSMMPRMQNGDVVIVQKQSDVESGDIAIVCINGAEATCKQLKKHANGITLISYNTAYEPMFFTNQEIDDKPITVLGKVVELRGKF